MRVGLGSGFVRESLVEGKRILIEKKAIFVSIFVLDCFFCVTRGALKIKFSIYLKLSDSLSEQTE